METTKKGLLLVCLALCLDLQAERSPLREQKDKQEEQTKKDKQKDQDKKRHHHKQKEKKATSSDHKKRVDHKKQKAESALAKKDSSKKSVGHRTHEKAEKRKQEQQGQPSKKQLAEQRKAERKTSHRMSHEDEDDSYVCKEEYSRKLYTDVDYGFLKTSLFKTTFLNSANLLQTVTQIHSAALPMIRMGFGLDFVGLRTFCGKTTHGRVGLEVAFAKRADALDTNYTGTSTAVIGRQGVFRGELMLMGSYDLWRDTLSVEGGIGVVGGALRNFALYQVNGEQAPLYTGQYLKPHTANLGGFIGVAVAHRFKDMERLRFEIGYRAVFSAVKYYTLVYQDAPNPLAATVWQTAYTNAQANGVSVLPAEPHFRICAQQLALSVVVDL